MISFLETKGVAKFKYPERLEIVEELPMTAGGKVSKQILELNIAEKMEKEGKIVANGRSV
jgi:non-ribosomal peptide synthetase component E (peptide arylation enzyme)